MLLQNWLRHAEYEPQGPIDWSYMDKKLDRADLITMRERYPEMDTLDLCACIFAWGGMKTHHGKVLFGHLDKRWVHVSNDLRQGLIDHFDAYQNFFDLAAADGMPRIGPAYYTKLLFFLPPRAQSRGIIMDQWTSRSVNLLTGEAIVRLEPSFLVKKSNSVDVYRRYNEVVRQLSVEIHGNDKPENVEEIELRLFSEGGRARHPWRPYVYSHARTTPR